jgi:hypothetical protein
MDLDLRELFSELGILESLVLAFFVASFYFLPSLLATLRNHRFIKQMWAVNFFFGWSFVAWGALVIWALIDGQVPLTVQKLLQKLKKTEGGDS